MSKSEPCLYFFIIMFLIPEFESFYHDAVKQGVKMLLLNFKDKTFWNDTFDSPSTAEEELSAEKPSEWGGWDWKKVNLAQQRAANARWSTPPPRVSGFSVEVCLGI